MWTERVSMQPCRWVTLPTHFLFLMLLIDLPATKWLLKQYGWVLCMRYFGSQQSHKLLWVVRLYFTAPKVMFGTCIGFLTSFREKICIYWLLAIKLPILAFKVESCFVRNLTINIFDSEIWISHLILERAKLRRLRMDHCWWVGIAWIEIELGYWNFVSSNLRTYYRDWVILVCILSRWDDRVLLITGMWLVIRLLLRGSWPALPSRVIHIEGALIMVDEGFKKVHEIFVLLVSIIFLLLLSLKRLSNRRGILRPSRHCFFLVECAVLDRNLLSRWNRCFRGAFNLLVRLGACLQVFKLRFL